MKLSTALILFVVLMPLAAAALWRLNPVIPDLTVNSALLGGNTLKLQNLMVDTNGHTHVLLLYEITTDTSKPIQIFDSDITANTSRLVSVNGMGILIGVGAVYTNGWYYRGTTSGGVSWRYNLSSGAVQILNTNSEDAIYSLAIDDNGSILWGTYPRSHVLRYTPSSGLFQDMGRSDTNQNGNFYAYTIAGDARYVYVGMKSLNNVPWYLGVIDTATSNSWTYFSNSITSSGAYVQRGVAGGIYYQKDGTNYQLIAGVPIPTNSVPLIDWGLTNYNVLVDESVFTASTAKDFDFGFAYPNSSNNVSTIRWATAGSNDWQTLSVSNFNIAGANLGLLSSIGSELFVIPSSYLPLIRYNPATETTSVIGATGSSLYAGINFNDDWFVSGYPAAAYKYDPSLPWNLSATTPNPELAGVNARKFSGSFGKYQRKLCVGSDGLLYVGVEHARDAVSGGDIGWYSIDGMTNVGNLHNPFSESSTSVRDMKPCLSATKLIYTCDATNTLFIFDVGSKTVTRTNNSILPSVSSLGQCVEVSPGIMLGVTESNLWMYNVNTDTTTVTNSLPGNSWSGFSHSYDCQLSTGSDGYVWLTLGNDLYRINPQTGYPSLVKTNVGPHNIFFSGGDAWLYNPSTPELHRLKDILLRESDLNVGTLTIRR